MTPTLYLHRLPSLAATLLAWCLLACGGGSGPAPGPAIGGSGGGGPAGAGGSVAPAGGTTGGAGAAGGGGVGGGGAGGNGGAGGSGGATIPVGEGAPDAGPVADAALLPDAVSPAADGGGPAAVSGNGCAGGKCLNPQCQPLHAAAPIADFAEVGFERQPSYIPNDVLVPTFDDVPDRPYTSGDGAKFSNFGDGDWTRKMLDFFASVDLHVDFFVNTANFCDLSKDAGCRTTVERMLRQHNVGNHTIHHVHMGSTLPFDGTNMFNNGCGGPGSRVVCEDEVAGVETFIDGLSGGALPHLTRFRAPYGEPFQASGRGLALVRGVVAKHAVHVGWAMESTDADHDPDHLPGQFFADKINTATGGGPGKGAWGIILMHGTYPWSLAEVKILLDPASPGSVQKRGFRLGTVEDVICWKYGKHSWQIVEQLAGQPRGPN